MFAERFPMRAYGRTRWTVVILALVLLVETWMATAALSRDGGSQVQAPVSEGPSRTWLPVAAALLASGMIASGVGLVMHLLGQLERDAKNLDRRIRMRTAELEAAKARAEETMGAQTRFLASMSHELRTPLNAIIGFSDALISGMFGPLAERHAAYVTDIHHSGLHLLALVNDLLDLAIIDAGEALLDEAEADLGEILDEVVHMLGPRAATGGIRLQRLLQPRPITLVIDRRRLLQTLLNVMTNAIKYTRPGGRVCLSALLHSEGQCLIAVADNGIGMSPNEVKEALAPFGRVANRETRGIEGTGQGLPLAIRLMDIHGGALSIDSVSGVGTTVLMAIPASRVRV